MKITLTKLIALAFSIFLSKFSFAQINIKHLQIDGYNYFVELQQQSGKAATQNEKILLLKQNTKCQTDFWKQ